MQAIDKLASDSNRASRGDAVRDISRQNGVYAHSVGIIKILRRENISRVSLDHCRLETRFMAGLDDIEGCIGRPNDSDRLLQED